MTRQERRQARELDRMDYRPLRWLTRSMEYPTLPNGAIQLPTKGQASTLGRRTKAEPGVLYIESATRGWWAPKR